MIFRSAAIELPAVAFHPLTGIPAQSFIRCRHFHHCRCRLFRYFHHYLPLPPPSPGRLHRLYIRTTVTRTKHLTIPTDRSCIKHTYISIHTYSCLFSSVFFIRAALSLPIPSHISFPSMFYLWGHVEVE